MTSDEIRDKMSECFKGIKAYTDYDALISRNGGLRGFKDAFFADVANDEFMYELDIAKNRIRKMTRNY